jgi:hypothetical protein
MSNSPFDFNLPFAPFAPFAPFTQLAPPAQRWLDMLTGSFPESAGAAAEWPLALYRNLFAGLPDPFKDTPRNAEAPAWPAGWADACSRAAAAMAEAQANAALQQAELCRSWLQAQPPGDAADAPARLARLHQRCTQNLAQYRGIVDEYLDAWFAAAGTVAEAWQAAQGEAAPDAPAGKPAPSSSRAPDKRH